MSPAAYDPTAPLVVQADRTALLEVHHPRYEEARDALARFAELERSPEHVHTYRISPLSLWNAAASGTDAAWIEATLAALSRYPLPASLVAEIRQVMGRYGRVRLERGATAGELTLVVDDPAIAAEVARTRGLARYLVGQAAPGRFGVPFVERGNLKQAMITLGYPVEDLAGFEPGEPLPLALRAQAADGRPFALRDYQREAVDVFLAAGTARGGHGVIVLPCGAGKTIVGLGAIAALGMRTLILTTNRTSLAQWRRELLDKTDVAEADVGEYSGDRKELRPITLSTYQLLTHRRDKHAPFTHHHLFTDHAWGLVVYDEVHLLPAPVFRATAAIQGTRRLGLTATLVREDGLETDVFSLIGPKRLEVPWKVLEGRGFIAEARCHEWRIALPPEVRLAYATAPERQRHRVAAENPRKLDAVAYLFARHPADQVLVIGQYLDQLAAIAKAFGLPLITGAVPQAERERLYEAFRNGAIRALVVSKVANFAVDLPDASVAIQVSGTFGSRQEEAQRLGRLLRPKAGTAHFYSLVSLDTSEQDFAMHRQLFLVEQGYAYDVARWEG